MGEEFADGMAVGLLLPQNSYPAIMGSKCMDRSYTMVAQTLSEAIEYGGEAKASRMNGAACLRIKKFWHLDALGEGYSAHNFITEDTPVLQEGKCAPTAGLSSQERKTEARTIII